MIKEKRVCYDNNMYGSSSTIRFCGEKGFGVSYFIICPVCWNASIKVTYWENGAQKEDECPVCERVQRNMTASF